MSNYQTTQSTADVIARAEMFRAGVGARQVSTEMLLVALAEEASGVAHRVLSNLGVQPGAIRAEVTRLTGLDLLEEA